MGAVIGVIGASGGVGTSTLAAVLAAVVGGVLVDGDAPGGGIDVLLGIEDVAGARWSAVEVAGGRIDPDHLTSGLPRWGATPVLAADTVPDPRGMRAVLEAGRRVAPVVVDLGRAPTPARAVAVGQCALVVAIVAADLPGVAAARSMLTTSAARTVALVVRRGYLDPGEVGDLVGAPVLGGLPALRQRTAAPLNPARLPGVLTRLAAGIADGVPHE